MTKVRYVKPAVAIKRSNKGLFESAEIRNLPNFSSESRTARKVAPIGALVLAVTAAPAIAGADGHEHFFQATRVETTLNQHSMSARMAERLSFLRAAGEEDEVHYPAQGEERMLAFLESYEVSCRPQVTLRDDGTLRALWRGRLGSEVSAKFADAGDLEIAILMQRQDRSPARWAGFDDEAGFLDVVYGLDAQELIFG